MSIETIAETQLPYPKTTGKVRDRYDCGDHYLMVTTDRLSAFDRAIATVPHKGEVLNQLSYWWFQQTQHIIPNHVIDCPDKRSMRVMKCHVIPIEVVIRQYLTGTTNTSIWTGYQQGQRLFFDTTLPDGLVKNTRLEQPILTPTTKADDHDEPLSMEMLASGQWVDPALWKIIAEKALALFQFASHIAEKAGFILADTKLEFGLDQNGTLRLIDECFTPDSSRYWLTSSYQEALAKGQEPEQFDKELLRVWFRNHCDPYKDKTLPQAPTELIQALSQRYMDLYKQITQHSLLS